MTFQVSINNFSDGLFKFMLHFVTEKNVGGKRNKKETTVNIHILGERIWQIFHMFLHSNKYILVSQSMLMWWCILDGLLLILSDWKSALGDIGIIFVGRSISRNNTTELAYAGMFFVWILCYTKLKCVFISIKEKCIFFLI